MKIIEGNIPEGKVWRVLLTLAPGRPLGRTWQLAYALAAANHGELVAAVTVPDSSEANLVQARADMAQIEAMYQEDGRIHLLLIEASAYDKDLAHFVHKADIDLLLTYAEDPNWRDLKTIPCAVGAVRGDQSDIEAGTTPSPLKNIIVPTSGGPNTAHALSFLLPLPPDIHVQALYVVPARLGPNEEALGRSRLRHLLNVVDAGERIETQLITSSSVIDGIVDAASQECDLVVLGASRESSLDKVLFGNIPGAVVRQSRKPIMIVRQPQRPLENLFGNLSWQLENFQVRLNLEERSEAYARIRRGARPDADFFILIALAAMIAGLGLIVNSPAVVIGAMLVAPLMSPMVGTGLAIVLGDTRFLRLSLGAVVRGAVLAVFVGMVAGLLHLNEPLTAELLARTQPTLIDLAIAIFSGMAGAYALSHSDAAGALPGVAIAAALVPPLATVGITLTNGLYPQSLGALLLFTTNFVAISAATAVTFLILGFRPTAAQKARREVQTRSVRIALMFVVIVAAMLAGFTYRLAQESAYEADMRTLVMDSVTEVTGGRIVSPQDLLIVGEINNQSAPLSMDLTVRSTHSIPYMQAKELQDAISIGLQREVGLTMTVILVTNLDPEIPPTLTPTPTASNTPTPGPTPTETFTPTPSPLPTETPTAVPTDTPTPSPTDTPTIAPTDTAVPTPTPRTAVINSPYGLNLRAEPGTNAVIVTFLAPDTAVILLDGRETADNLTWQQIEVNGQTGWVSDRFLTMP
ncbi:MAG: DUF389 domain-containing protein [Ardenticatenaceae bacterium]|nr:DUF389 domain-containing protein [Ardenticatenaceae bacterium]